jgi:hypothetical protein
MTSAVHSVRAAAATSRARTSPGGIWTSATSMLFRRCALSWFNAAK